MGGGLFTHLNHGDAARRKAFKARHGAQGHYKKQFSPAWFSWHFLW